jgi:XTP/dITP diphosphohydrolase
MYNLNRSTDSFETRITNMKKGNKIILGTRNPHKKEKLKWIVEGFFGEVLELNSTIDVEENGDSFEENAKIKALAIAKTENTFAIATDGGVLIPALGKDWNALLTRRFAGEEDITDFDRMNVLLEMMKGRKGEERTITWKESIAIASPQKVIFSMEVDGDTGSLQEAYDPKQYKEGIWLCTLWSYPQFGGRNFFDLNEEEKKYGEISWWKLRDGTREFLTKHFSIRKM